MFTSTAIFDWKIVPENFRKFRRFTTGTSMLIRDGNKHCFRLKMNIDPSNKASVFIKFIRKKRDTHHLHLKADFHLAHRAIDSGPVSSSSLQYTGCIPGKSSYIFLGSVLLSSNTWTIMRLTGITISNFAPCPKDDKHICEIMHHYISSQRVIRFSVQGMSLFCKKKVLTANSPVFKAMLNSPFVESEKSSLEVPYNHYTFRQFILFLLHGRVRFSENPLDPLYLYQLADYYFVKPLMDICLDRALRMASKANFDVYMYFATLLRIPELLELLDTFK